MKSARPSRRVQNASERKAQNDGMVVRQCRLRFPANRYPGILQPPPALPSFTFPRPFYLSPYCTVMALADYLAKNYLNADPKPDKKSKKRKRKAASDGLVIADDDSDAWKAQAAQRDRDEGPVMSAHDPSLNEV